MNAAERKPGGTVDPKAAPRTDVDTKAAPEVQATPAGQPSPQAKAGPIPESKVQPKGENKAEPEAAKQPTPQAGAEDVSKPEAKADTPQEVAPQLVKRVHAFYEELGRDVVRAVEESDKAPAAPHDAEKPE